jgi:hypothetical protein
MSASGSAFIARPEVEIAGSAEARAPSKGRQPMSDDRPEWFEPKRFGYGSGMPIAWQGWAILLGFFAMAFAAAYFLHGRLVVLVAVILPLCLALGLITARTTRGGWRWRWGSED